MGRPPHYPADAINIKIDGRGQSGQSDEHMYAVYKNLGTVSVDDQISVTRKLIKEHKFMDREKVGIWGTSYGGYMTLMTLGRDSGPDSVFKCGISGKMYNFYLCLFIINLTFCHNNTLTYFNILNSYSIYQKLHNFLS